MDEINDQSSDTSSDLNWSLVYSVQGQQHDRVVFEAVADQYVKDEDITAFFTTLPDVKVNSDEDQIGLLRVGSTNIKECIAYAPVQFTPSTSSGSIRHGTAKFSASLLSVTDDEFYQFCYIFNKTKNLGSSIPFQLNCESDDMSSITTDSPIVVPDDDNRDLLAIHTKCMLTEEKLRQENQQLLNMNRQLEAQKDECQAKLDSIEATHKKQIDKLNNEIQDWITTHKTAIDELTSLRQSETKLRTEYDASRALCDQYQTEASENAERCRVVEPAQADILSNANQIRSQLAVTSQLTKDQATNIIDLERRLMQSNELSKTSNQRQGLLEQQLRDLRLTSKTYQMSVQGQLDEYSKRTAQRDDRINELETINNLLKEELNSCKADNELLSSVSKQDKDLIEPLNSCKADNELLSLVSKQDKDLIEQLKRLENEHRQENERARNEIELLRTQLSEKDCDQQAYMTLKTSFTEIEKRFIKHQKTEIEVKRQLADYQSSINDLKREIQDLTGRLAAGTDEYETLYRKYTALERSMEQPKKVGPIHNPCPNDVDSYPIPRNPDGNTIQSIRPSPADMDGEVKKCPACFWEFPQNLNIEGKREHIEQHFD